MHDHLVIRILYNELVSKINGVKYERNMIINFIFIATVNGPILQEVRSPPPPHFIYLFFSLLFTPLLNKKYLQIC